MLVSAGVQSAYAITGDEVAADKSYTAASTRAEEPGGDWEGYRVDVSFDVKDGKLQTSILILPGMDELQLGIQGKGKAEN